MRSLICGERSQVIDGVTSWSDLSGRQRAGGPGPAVKRFWRRLDIPTSPRHGQTPSLRNADRWRHRGVNMRTCRARDRDRLTNTRTPVNISLPACKIRNRQERTKKPAVRNHVRDIRLTPTSAMSAIEDRISKRGQCYLRTSRFMSPVPGPRCRRER